MKKKNKERWELINYVTTSIIAFIAILGFIFTQISSNQTSKLLKETAIALNNVNDAVYSFVNPIIYFYNYDWLRGNKIDCVNPPIGITLRFKNGSNIPIKVKKYKVNLSCGGYFMNTEKWNTNERILTNDYNVSSTFIFSEEIKKLFINKINSYEEPNLIFEFNGIISNISESITYEVKLITQINFDCGYYNVRNHSILLESYKLIPTN